MLPLLTTVLTLTLTTVLTSTLTTVLTLTLTTVLTLTLTTVLTLTLTWGRCWFPKKYCYASQGYLQLLKFCTV